MVDETDVRANDSVLALRARFAREGDRPRGLAGWVLPFAGCFAGGIWLAVLLVFFAPDLTAHVARLAREAAARVPAPDVVQEPAEYVAQWDEPAEPYTVVTPLVPPTPGNCDEARAWGLAPAYVGQPGYAPWLDGDHDGISCEPRRRHRIYLR